MRLLPLLLASTFLLAACGQQDAAPAADAAPGAATATPDAGIPASTEPQAGEPGAADAATADASPPVESNATPLPGEPGGPELATAAPTPPTEFDPASVPESTASLPPFERIAPAHYEPAFERALAFEEPLGVRPPCWLHALLPRGHHEVGALTLDGSVELDPLEQELPPLEVEGAPLDPHDSTSAS